MSRYPTTTPPKKTAALTISRLSSLIGGGVLLSMFFPIPQWLAFAELVVLIGLLGALIVAWRNEVKQ